MTGSVTFHVTGMTCDHCAHAVTEELGTLAGVSAVSVELVPAGNSVVTVTSEQPLDLQTVAVALAEAGDYHLSGA
jgi:copper chaperone